MATVVRDRGGRPVATHGFVIDVTERRQAETALRESEYFLHRSQSVGHIGSYKMDAHAGTWICTPELEEIFGLPANHPKTVESWLELIVPEERAEMLDARDPVVALVRALLEGDAGRAEVEKVLRGLLGQWRPRP